MNAIHLLTQTAADPLDAELVEMAVRNVDGVEGVSCIHSLGLTSVLFDEQRTDTSCIVNAVRRVGFEPRVCWRNAQSGAPDAHRIAS